MEKEFLSLARCAQVVLLLVSSALPMHAQFKVYDKIEDFDDNGYAVVYNNYATDQQTSGVIDKSGREIVPLNYYEVRLMNSDVATVEKKYKGMQALFSLKSGKQITDFKYYWVSFYGDKGFAETENGNEIIDSKGKTILKTNLEDADHLGDGFLFKRIGDNCMLYNFSGEPISKEIFWDAYHFGGEGVDRIKPENGWIKVWMQNDIHDTNLVSHWLCNDGTLLSDDEYMSKIKHRTITFRYDYETREYEVISTSDGHVMSSIKADDWISDEGRNILVHRYGEGWGIIGYDGKVIVPCGYYEYIHGFSEGLTFAKDAQGNEFFMDYNGKNVLDLSGNNMQRASRCYIFKNGLFGIKQNGREGFINRNGRIVIPAQFKEVRSFKDGHAIVEDFQERYGMIDTLGNFVVPPCYKECYHDTKGFAKVKLDNGKWTIVKIHQ